MSGSIVGWGVDREVLILPIRPNLTREGWWEVWVRYASEDLVWWTYIGRGPSGAAKIMRVPGFSEGRPFSRAAPYRFRWKWQARGVLRRLGSDL